MEIKSKQFFKKGKETDPKKINKIIVTPEEKKKLRGFVRIETYKCGKKIRETEEMENLVMLGANTGITLLLQRLIGVNTYSANITHADIGTGTNPATQADTKLQTAIVRAVRGSESVSGSQANMSFFFPDALLPNGSYNEFGTFIDGTISVDTGQIFNHLVFASPYVKASGEDTTIRVRFTLS